MPVKTCFRSFCEFVCFLCPLFHQAGRGYVQKCMLCVLVHPFVFVFVNVGAWRHCRSVYWFVHAQCVSKLRILAGQHINTTTCGAQSTPAMTRAVGDPSPTPRITQPDTLFCRLTSALASTSAIKQLAWPFLAAPIVAVQPRCTATTTQPIRRCKDITPSSIAEHRHTAHVDTGDAILPTTLTNRMRPKGIQKHHIPVILCSRAHACVWVHGVHSSTSSPLGSVLTFGRYGEFGANVECGRVVQGLSAWWCARIMYTR
jgi:hypothetical protein